MHVYLATRQSLTVEAQPFAAGGQGAIYRFDRTLHPTLRLRVAKILNSGQTRKAKEPRIQYLCAQRPSVAQLPNPDCLAWPEQCLYDDHGIFIGLMLPLVAGGIELENLCVPNGTRNPRYARFSAPGAAGRQQRLRIARNLVEALAAFDAAGEFVLTDLKPQNAIVKPTGEVALIDLDAMQICSQGQLLFRGTGYTDEYPPPEFYQGRVDLSRDRVDKSFERFSMAVILYRLLLNIHPYAGPSDAADVLDAIKRGYFVWGPKRHKFAMIPRPHNDFQSLDPAIQQLFLHAFDDGNSPDQRPSAQQWAAAFAQAGVQAATANPKHVRAAWAALFGMSPPPPPIIDDLGQASIWNPYPTSGHGRVCDDTIVDAQLSEKLETVDPVSGCKLTAMVYDIWLTGGLTPAVIGKRVALSYYIPPTYRGFANFHGEGWLGRRIRPRGNCVRDIYGSLTFTIRIRPAAAPLFSRKRWCLRTVALTVTLPKNVAPRASLRGVTLPPAPTIKVKPLAPAILRNAHSPQLTGLRGRVTAGLGGKVPRLRQSIARSSKAIPFMGKIPPLHPFPPLQKPPRNDKRRGAGR